MRKLTVLIAGGVGYVLGARAGRERYEQIRRTALRVKENPTVQSAASSAADAAKDAAPVVKDKVVGAADAATQKVKGSDDDLESSAYPTGTSTS
jgi:hypothetical protein